LTALPARLRFICALSHSRSSLSRLRAQSERVAALQQEVNALKHLNAVAQEKVFGLEECLTAKDTELKVRDAELNHLRYACFVNSPRAHHPFWSSDGRNSASVRITLALLRLVATREPPQSRCKVMRKLVAHSLPCFPRFLIGVKEGNIAQVERQLAFVQGKHSEDFVVDPEDNIAEVSPPIVLDCPCISPHPFLILWAITELKGVWCFSRAKHEEWVLCLSLLFALCEDARPPLMRSLTECDRFAVWQVYSTTD